MIFALQNHNCTIHCQEVLREAACGDSVAYRFQTNQVNFQRSIALRIRFF